MAPEVHLTGPLTVWEKLQRHRVDLFRDGAVAILGREVEGLRAGLGQKVVGEMFQVVRSHPGADRRTSRLVPRHQPSCSVAPPYGAHGAPWPSRPQEGQGSSVGSGSWAR